jgi:hypothetical protein
VIRRRRTPRKRRRQCERLHISAVDLWIALVGVELAYEAAFDLADTGRASFGPFEGLKEALRILRGWRDEAEA